VKVQYGQWDWFWHIRLLPSIEVSNFRKAGLENHYEAHYEITFRWLPYWLSILI